MGEPASPAAAAARASQYQSNTSEGVPPVNEGGGSHRKVALQTLKGPVVSESGKQIAQGDIEGLHGEIYEIRQAYTRLQTFYRMKFQTLRQCYEQKIQAFTTTLSSNSDLWERASEIKEREIIAEEELNRSQRRVAAAADTIERISSEAAKEAETAAKP